MSDPPEKTEDPGTTRVLPRKPSQGSDGERSIGPYRLLQLLGEGGMGEVWLARQERPVRRMVAVKILKAGLDSKRVVARFEAERQALALMDHPAVAKVFDAGTTPGGRPFVVMEHVPGLPITAHCDLHRLSTRERLELFLKVCAGVQHAHHKAVIHRDLKPSNVLVTLQDGTAVPKIIDFGLAKALAQPLTERTLFTEVGSLVGTPEYMSPEQAQPTAQDIDTRTDVYSLGVILYELLVGAMPFDSEALRAAGFAGVLLHIVTHDPARPSQRLSGMAGTEPSEQARRRRADVATLRRQLAGDLDWITMKALERERSRRYGSPTELAADIERHLSEQPVLARPPSALYRARKLARRHTAAVVIATAALILLVAFAVGMAWQAQRIALERDRANREAETSGRALGFLTELFEVADPEEARGDLITAREVLDRGAQRLEAELAGEPLVQARLMLTVANVYRGLGLPAPGAELAKRSLELRRGHLGEEHPETLESRRLLGRILLEKGDLEGAEAHLRKTLESRRKVLGSSHPRTLESLGDVGQVWYTRGKLEAAERPLREALEGRRRALGEGHPETLESASSLGGLLWAQGRRAEAEPFLRDAVEGFESALGDDHPRTLAAMRGLGALLHELGRREQAEPYYRRALEGHRRVLGEGHPRTLRVLSDMAALLREQGRLEEAEPFATEALEGAREVLGPEHPSTLSYTNAMGVLLFSQGRLDEAEPYIRHALEGRRRVLGEEHRHTLTSLSNLGSLLQRRGELEEAELVFLEALEVRRRTLGEDHPDTLLSLSQIGVLLSVDGDLEGAEPYLRRVADGRRRALGDRHRRTLRAVRNLGSLLRRMGDFEAAEPQLQEALDGFRQSLGDEHAETILSTLDLAALRRDQGRVQESTELTAWALAQAKKALSPSNSGVGEALVSHGLNLALAGRFPEAEAALLEGRDILAAADPARAQEAAEHLAELYRRRSQAR